VNRCPSCGRDNPGGTKFCGECGARLVLPCGSCGTANPPGNKFCGECGAALAGDKQAPGSTSNHRTSLPKHLAERILVSKAGLEGERKQVTVLFADLKGSTELMVDRDPEQARKLLDPVLDHMIEAVHRFEGMVNQVMGDGIMALFGAPLAHEDHAVRACYAALRMQESVKRYAEGVRRVEGVPIRIRVGLNSGEVVVRAIGSDLHMDYTAVGQTTHIAARMEQLAAPETIALTRTTLRLAEGFVDARSLGPIPVKGLSEPIEVFELLGATAARSRLHAVAARGLTKFVGRSVEMGQLHDAIELVRSGRGQVVAVVGEAGLGKSRLLWEFARSQRTEGCLIVEAASASYGKATPYWPVVELLKTYFAIAPRDDPRTVRERVVGRLFALDRALEPCVAPLLSLLDVPVADETWHALDTSERRRRILDSVKHVLLREGQAQPTIVVFEDLHWIDSETQTVLDTLVESLPGARLLLLVNYRPEYQHGWGSKTYYRQLRIDPLVPASADELLDGLLGRDAELMTVKRLLIEQAQGNPFVIEETVRNLAETGVLLGQRGAYRLAEPVEKLSVPATAQAILAARIDRLDVDDKRRLQAAAVVGSDVPLSLLQMISGDSEDALRATIARLQAAEFLYEARLFPEVEYTFKHALTHDVAYGSLLHDQRRELHAKVVQALEQLHGDRQDPPVKALAHHAVQAQMWDRAHRYLRAAATHAVGASAFSEAARLLEHALVALEHLPATTSRDADQLDTLVELWTACFETGKTERIGALQQQIEPLARALAQEPRLASVLVRRAQASWGHIHLGETITSAAEALRLAAVDDVRTRAYARFLSGAACRDLGNFDEAFENFERGARLFDALPLERPDASVVFPILVSLCAWEAEAHAVLGRYGEAVRAAEHGLAVAGRVRSESAMTFAKAFLGYARLLHGDIGHALPMFEDAATTASGFGKIFVGSMLAYALALDGQHARALAQLDEDVRLRTSGYIQSTRFRTLIVGTYLAGGRPDDALRELDVVIPIARGENARGHLPTLLRLRAETLMRYAAADLDAVMSCCQEARDLADETGQRPEVARSRAMLGTALVRAGRVRDGRAELDGARASLRALGMQYWADRLDMEWNDGRPRA
jgi:class 3 adenylate cyclase/tetratricopeptide (TPR) repeat protein